MKVLILDRALSNPYSQGLAGGLRKQRVDTALAGPAKWQRGEVLPFYHRATMAGDARAAKLAETGLGVWHAARYGWSVRPDILHVQWPSLNDIMLAHVVTATSRARIVLTLHNPSLRHSTDGDRFHAAALRMADQIIVHGPMLRDQVLALWPEFESRVHCVAHGNYDHVITHFALDDARAKLGLPHDRPIYSFIGSVRRRKGVEDFIRALAICRDRETGVCGVIAGVADDPDYVAELRALGASLALTPSLRWEIDNRPVSQDRLDLVTSAADQIVLPFLGASQSGSVILAMTHGRCVVTSAVGELPRTLAGRGILVPPASPEALACAMREAIDNPGLCRRFGELARQHALGELSWTRVATETLAIYERAIEGP
jgi:glycosyltransferase involved in cell wall biosynthesis